MFLGVLFRSAGVTSERLEGLTDMKSDGLVWRIIQSRAERIDLFRGHPEWRLIPFGF